LAEIYEGSPRFYPNMDTFGFEQDYADGLQCIPMAVRLRLDTCQVKLKLAEWSKLEPLDRARLLTMPCTTAAETASYRAALHQLVRARTGHLPADLPAPEPPLWLDAEELPPQLHAKAQAEGASLSLAQWRSLTVIQRFALVKLSRPSHENRNFLPALREFGLLA
jgi:hypothetical protein